MIEFEIRWLDYAGQVFATDTYRAHDLTAAVRFAGRRLAGVRSRRVELQDHAARAHGVRVVQA